MFFRFANPWALYVGVPLLLLVAWYRWFQYQPVTYVYPLADFLRTHPSTKKLYAQPLLFVVRLVLLAILLLLVAQPQLVDRSSQLPVEGRDIVLVLDMSGSMQCFDDQNDRRTRFEVARTEAVRFVGKREHDALGLVIFGRGSLTRCPLTFDKKILRRILDELEFGLINPQGTFLATAMVTAANRLKQSSAESKVMILLTDGSPQEDPIPVEAALDMIKKLGIKVYAIGVGDEQGGLIDHPWFGLVSQGVIYNAELLAHIAQESGGAFFEARKPADMRRIYDQIDALETSAHEVPAFSRYTEWFLPFAWSALMLAGLELVLAQFLWLVI